MPETTDRLAPESAIAFHRNHRSRWSEIRTFIEPAEKVIDTATQLRNNVIRAGLCDLVLTLAKFSADVAQHFELPVELLFIDADHHYPAVKSDFELWFPKVVKGGTLAFHDAVCDEASPIQWPGVGQLCAEIQDQGLVRNGYSVRSLFVCEKA